MIFRNIAFATLWLLFLPPFGTLPLACPDNQPECLRSSSKCWLQAFHAPFCFVPELCLAMIGLLLDRIPIRCFLISLVAEYGPQLEVPRVLLSSLLAVVHSILFTICAHE